MKTKLSYLIATRQSNRIGLLVFGVMTLLTAIVLAATPHVEKRMPQGTVKMSAKISQTKLVKNGDSTVYVDVTLKAPDIAAVTAQQATDMVLVLDRSGSMSGANKMPYAKAAIRELLDGLTQNDRFALVSFADSATLHTPLLPLGSETRAQIRNMVNGINPSGGTNMGEGLDKALEILEDTGTGRARKVLLLSDGQANQGISSPQGLAQLVAKITRQGAVLSSIGMGLDFNETLMSSLADHGMGHYAYLEDLSGLGAILGGQMQDTRNIYSANSRLEIDLADGVRLLDAGGYPITANAHSAVSVASGQLLSGSEKRFVMTFRVPTENTGQFSLAAMKLVYALGDEHHQVVADKNALMLTVVEPERGKEAIASVDKDVYQQSWLKNNLGRMQKKLSSMIRQGDKYQAAQVISDYREAVAKAETATEVPLASAAMNDKLNEMERQLADSFEGNRADQEVKRKRAAKSLQFGGIKEQRTVQ